MRRLNLILVVAFLGMATVACAQKKKYDYGTDSVNCVQNLSLFNEFIKQKEYADAYGPWKKCVEICPKSRKGLYTNGRKMFQYLIKNESDPAKKAVLVEELMGLYDTRVANYGEKGAVYGMKGLSEAKYFKDDPCRATSTMKESIDFAGNKSQAAVVSGYFISLYKCYKKDGAPVEDLYTEYLRLSEIISYNIENLEDSTKAAKYAKAKRNMDANFVKVAKCSDIVEIFKKQVDAAPNDLELKKRALRLMSRKECDDDPFFVTIAEQVHAAEPSHESAYALARMFAKKKEIDKALQYYEEAVRICAGCAEMENYLEKAGLVASGSGKHGKASGYAQDLLRINPSNPWGYIIKGNRLMASSSSCDDGKLGKFCAYWLAAGQYQKAIGAASDSKKAKEFANKQLANARSRFPDKTIVFQTGHSEGQSYNCSCGGTVTIQIKK